MAYLTLAEAKAFIGNTTDTHDDLLEDVIIPDAQGTIEGDSGTGRVFEAGSDTARTFDYELDVVEGVLQLGRDLCQITSINNGGTLLTTADYYSTPRGVTPFDEIRLRNGASWSTTADGIVITGRWAYSITPPNNIKRAMRRLVKYMYNQRDTNNDVDRPMVTDMGITFMPGRIPADIMALLYPYRRRT